MLHQFVSQPLQNKDECVPVQPEKSIPEPQGAFTNPLAAVTASFLEPVMKTAGVYILAVRASFNAVTCKDPFLSFWTLVFLTVVTLILAFFPWRLFFFFAGLVCFGPQVGAVS